MAANNFIQGRMSDSPDLCEELIDLPDKIISLLKTKGYIYKPDFHY